MLEVGVVLVLPADTRSCIFWKKPHMRSCCTAHTRQYVRSIGVEDMLLARSLLPADATLLF